MQISRIYSNKETIFNSIDFNCGEQADILNVIYGAVNNRKDKTKTTHNLGKTTLIHLIDFMFLKDVRDDFFLIKHQARFAGFVFFMEIALDAGGFVTVRRSVENPNSIAIKKHEEPKQSFVELSDDEWDHESLTTVEGIKLLDAFFNIRILSPSYDYRKALTYFLRTQGDFQDELQLQKFQKGKDKYWKPFVAQLFGFNPNTILRKYELDEEIDGLKKSQAEKQTELAFSEEQLPELINRISLLNIQIGTIEESIDAFRFDEEERKMLQEVVGSVEVEVSDINNRLYNINYDLRQIDNAINSKDKFDLKEIEEIFKETQLHFPEQLKHKYESLVEFNKKITNERNAALRTQLKSLTEQSEQLNDRRIVLENKRAEHLKTLRNTDTFEKFKVFQKDLGKQRGDLVYLTQQQKSLEGVAEITKKIREMERERGRVIDEMKAMVASPNPVSAKVSLLFNEYCKRVLHMDGLFFFKINSSNNFDYEVGLSLPGQINVASSQSDGTSYKKIMCALLDMALLKVYEDKSFYHFVYHDGIFESLDDKMKVALLELIRENIANKKTQYILTLITADLPRDEDEKVIPFKPEEIVLELNDSGPQGQLFKMAAF